ncbi:MAG: methyltransferase domain-containing protein, partial [Lachnospiraceae bacterium]|nr:methyltransferase domain-containing protein [Lachnospiraceae bacterium]
VQDLSSQMSIEAADIKEGDSVLDLCASPGGKTMTAADILAGSGRVEARDISPEKVGRIIENISRCGFKNVNASVHDACIFDQSCERAFDVVIADVPCSGYGVIGKKPDIKYGVSKEKETELIKIQRQILDTACRYVRPGGTLVFSTCTVNREENAENAAWFVRNHEGFEKVFEEQLLPDEFHDGFYTARFIYGH